MKEAEEKAKEMANLVVATNGYWTSVSIAELMKKQFVNGYLAGYEEAKSEARNGPLTPFDERLQGEVKGA
jgi:hypothetical protein